MPPAKKTEKTPESVPSKTVRKTQKVEEPENTPEMPKIQSENRSKISWSIVFIATVFSSVIAAGIVFAGLKTYPELFTVSNIDEQVDKGIERFIAKQQEQQESSAQQEQAAAEQAVQAVRPADLKEDHIRGNKDAQITVIEYSDFECPYCKKNHPTLAQVAEKYGDDVNFVYRHLPLPFHLPNAQDQAEASECVAELEGNDAFWQFTDLIYERTPSNKGFDYEKLRPLAEEVGVKGDAFDACMASDKFIPLIQQQTEEANKLGIQGTPANIIRDNKAGTVKYLGGAYPFENFVQIIDEMLK